MENVIGFVVGLVSLGLVLLVIGSSLRRMDEEKERHMHRTILRVVLLEPQFISGLPDLINVWPPESVPRYALGLLKRGMLCKVPGGRVAITDPGMRYLEVLEGE